MRPIFTLALLVAILFAAPASAAWLEASTDHFLITSDTTPDQLRAYATRLERYDLGLRKLFKPPQGEDEGRRSNRVRIYVVAGGSEVRALCGPGCANVMGFYTPRAGGSVIFTPKRSGRHRLWLRGNPGEWHFRLEPHVPPKVQ